MDILSFIIMYIICTLVLLLIVILILKFMIKKKCFTFSEFAEKEIDNYFKAYDDNINELLNDMRGDSNDDSINR